MRARMSAYTKGNKLDKWCVHIDHDSQQLQFSSSMPTKAENQWAEGV